MDLLDIIFRPYRRIRQAGYYLQSATFSLILGLIFAGIGFATNITALIGFGVLLLIIGILLLIGALMRLGISLNPLKYLTEK